MGILTVSTVCGTILVILGLIYKFLAPLVKSPVIAGILSRAKDEVFAAVHEVDAGYVDAIKLASADGTLTAAEKAVAKDKAIAIAKSNIGMKGLATLSRIAGIESVEKWIASWIERGVSTKRLTEQHADAATLAASAVAGGDATVPFVKPAPNNSPR